MADIAQLELGEDRSLLILDDDEPFLRRLAKAMEKNVVLTLKRPALSLRDVRLLRLGRLRTQ